MKKALVFLTLIVALFLCLTACNSHEHSFGEWTTTKAPTCEQDGEQERACSCGEVETRAIMATGHKWTGATCKAPKTCSDCGKTEGSALEHNWTEATCTTPKTCLNCNTTEGMPGGHKFGSWDTTVVPTCVDKGEMVRICSECKFEEKTSINPITSNHKPVIDPAVPATCTEPGLEEGSHCELCPVIIKAQEVIPAKGHTKEIVPGYDSTCIKTGLTNGEKCSVCHITLLEQKEIPLKQHVFDDDYDAICNNAGCDFVKDPKCRHSNTEPIPGYPATCTVDGYEDGEQCSDCQEILLERKLIKAPGHTEEPIPAVTATCYSTGLTAGVKCKVCCDILKAQETVDKLDHTPAKEAEENRINATCTEDGSYDLVVYCSVEKCKCKISSEHKTIPANGHTPGAEATCTIAQICFECHEIITPALGHDWKEATCTEPKTCQRTGCEITEGEALGHTYTKKTTPPTSTEKGYTTYTCHCGDSYTNDYTDATGSIGLVYKVGNDGKTYTVTGIGTCTDSHVVIPSTYNGLPVTSIGDYAFEDCTSLTSITIPDSVTSIGKRVFGWCTSLMSVTFGDNSRLTSIGDSAFRNCTSLMSVTLGDNSRLTSIGDSAFYDCTSLTSITIPDSVISIGNVVFGWCTSLMSVTFGDNSRLTSIGDSAFHYCNKLEFSIYDNCKYLGNANNPYVALIETVSRNYSSYEIHQSTKVISDYAFDGCEKLTTITIPNSVTSIGNYAFQYCRSLTSIVIGDSVTTIGSSAFHSCSNLKRVCIGNNVTSIGDGAFYNCSNLYKIINNSNLEFSFGSNNNGNITYYAKVIVDKNGNKTYNNTASKEYIETDDFLFELENGRYTLVFYVGTEETVTLPNNINGQSYAIYQMRGVINVIVPDSVTRIGYQAFFNSDLTSIVIPDSVISIESEAFAWCTKLTSITVEASNPNYKSIDGNLYSKDGKYLKQYALGKTDTHFIIPDSVTYIESRAFARCNSLTNITIPDKVAGIHSNVFSHCSNLTNVTIGNSVSFIGASAFSSCDSLTSVTFTDPDGWYVTETYGETSGTNLTLNDPITNAKYLKSNYGYSYYWYKNN